MVLMTIEGKQLRLNCDGCGVEFFRRNFTHIRRHPTHFHSKICHDKFQRTSNLKRNKVCAHCGVAFYDSSKRPDAGTCCSKKCSYDKMSKTRHEKGSYSSATLYSNCNRGYRADIDITVRSNWEANFARICSFLNKKWSYEPCIIQLKQGTYIPDFEIENEGYVEIKGRSDSDDAMKKYRSFVEENPNVQIQLITAKEYDELRKKFKASILWEGK